MKLLETKDIMDVLADAVTYQLEKFQNVQKTSEGRDWYQELPKIIKEKFDNYQADYENLSRIMKMSKEEITNEMRKGYYYWRLLRSACNTFRNDLSEYDQQLYQEFNLKETSAISDNPSLNQCIEVLDKHAIEN